ncbi:hypothetical protein AciM339_0005 [Aciduliprofundum sp. MAR08-339]|nr:hypothetical protein AciM339_0005 [Aciduliprofundum sp. MAR08-339]
MVHGARIMRRIYRKEGGIASTVGTIFALMIFTSLLSMFMVQVVPVQIKESEAEHDMQVLSQFSQLRSMVDLLTLTKNTNYTAYVPIKLGAPGVPVVASPTYGQLSVYPAGLNTTFSMNVSFYDKYSNFIYLKSQGSIQFTAPNRYYVPETFSYENGAILRYNFYAKNAIMPIKPDMKFVNSSRYVNITMTLQSIYGLPVTVTGVETRSLGISLEGINTQTYFLGGKELNITINDTYYYGLMPLNFTKYWINFIMQALNSSGIAENAPPSATYPYYTYTPGGNTIHIFHVWNLKVKMVYLQIEVGS